MRIIAGVWVLAGMVLVNSYSSTVISYLTLPKMKPPIKTFEDLAASKEVGIALRADLVLTKQILVSNIFTVPSNNSSTCLSCTFEIA